MVYLILAVLCGASPLHIPPHMLDCTIAIFEELFHIYQRMQDPSWQNGDLEFEAKVLDYLLAKIWNDQGISDVENSYVYNFLTNPNDNSYQDAFDLYYMAEYEYSHESFPITPGLSPEDRIKHIRL